MKFQHLQYFYKKEFGNPLAFNTFELDNVMTKFLFLIFSISFFTLSTQAQTDTVRINVTDSLTQDNEIDSSQILTNVNVFKDPRLDALKRRPKLVARKNTRTRVKEDIIRKRKEKLGVSGVRNLKNYGTIKRGKKRVTGSIVTRKGYRVNIFSGPSRAKALAIKRKFMRSYGGTRSYMSYRTPSFKIKVGNFASKKSAYRFLRKIQSSGFSRSFVVPDIVTIKKINVR